MKTIIDIFEESVNRYGDKHFLLEKVENQYQPLTYRQTQEKAIQFGAGLISLGIEKDDRITLIAEGCNNWLISELGIFYAGAINVPITVKMNEPHDLIFRINHSGSKIIITSINQWKKIEKIIPELPKLEKIIIFEKQDNKDFPCYSFNEVIEFGKTLLSNNPERIEQRRKMLKPEDYATICYTSGTTADPKGVILTHSNYDVNTSQALGLIDVPSYYTTLLILPWDHSFAHTVIYAVIKSGASIASVQVGKTPLDTLKNIPINIKEVKPHFILSVPALAKNFRKNIENAIESKGKIVYSLFNFALQISYFYNGLGYNKGKGLRKILKPFVIFFDILFFSKIRENFGGRMEFFVGGGAYLEIDIQYFFYAIGIPILQGYGLSEASPIISANSLKKHKLGTSGQLVPNMECKICDENGNTLPIDVSGEILVKGGNVMAGYWLNEEATKNTIVDGWLHTGDMGHIDGDNYLYVEGRFKSLLIANDGEKYSPEAIEETIMAHSHFIDQCMLYNNQNPYTVALVVPNKEAIKKWLAEHYHHRDHDDINAALKLIESEINEYRTGKKYGHLFPQRWLPAAIAILSEPFSEENQMINSTLKLVRGKVVEYYKNRIEILYTTDGKNVYHQANRDEMIKLLK